MKTVYFIRHAKSSWKDPSLPDYDRPLNKRGFRDAPRMSKLLHEKKVKPDRLISSPARRALTTATFFAEALGIGKDDIQLEPRLYEGLTTDVLAMLQQLPEEWSTVLVFGHNPMFTTLANLFSGELIENVPTCGVVQVEAPVSGWSDFGPETAGLKAFFYPKQFKK